VSEVRISYIVALIMDDETSVYSKETWHYIRQNHDLYTRCRENLISHKINAFTNLMYVIRDCILMNLNLLFDISRCMYLASLSMEARVIELVIRCREVFNGLVYG
jgi:hypothetical protein